MDQQTKDELMHRWQERWRTGDVRTGHELGDAAEAIAAIVIDIVADARELERGATMAGLLSRPVLLEPAPYGGPEVYTDERKVAAAEALERFDADTRQHAGFAMTTELTGSIERASVTITAEFIEGLWSGADHIDVFAVSFDDAENIGTVGRFTLWRMLDGSAWATDDAENGVMVVKPGPQP